MTPKSPDDETLAALKAQEAELIDAARQAQARIRDARNCLRRGDPAGALAGMFDAERGLALAQCGRGVTSLN